MGSVGGARAGAAPLTAGYLAVLSILIGSLIGAGRAEAAWTLDRSFSGDGRVTADFGRDLDAARDVAVQPDGKIVVAGESASGGSSIGDFALARFNPDGEPDSGFGGGDGMVTTDFGASDRGWAVAVQPDGKLVVAGTTSSGRDFAVARYTAAGLLDPSFSGDGRATADFGDEAFGRDLAIQADGKIIVAGHTFENPGSGPDRRHFALARFNPDGSLDAGFGSGQPAGRVVTDFGRDATVGGMALQPDGKPVLAGYVGSPAADVAVARYTSAGLPDPSFSGDGRLVTDLGGADSGDAVVLQPDGKIVVGGGSDNGVALLRYRPGGSLDPTFGDAGRVLTDHFAGAQDLAIQPNGKLVAARWQAAFPVMRFNADGSPDSRFGPDEGIDAEYFDSPNGALPYGVAIQSDGRIVAAGEVTRPDGAWDFAVARFGPPLVDPGGSVPPRIRIGINRRLHLRRTIALRLRCPRESCRVRVKGTLVVRGHHRKRFRLHGVRARLAHGEKRRLRLRLRPRARGAARRALRHGGRVKARLKVVAVNSAGSRRVKHEKVKLVG